MNDTINKDSKRLDNFWEWTYTGIAVWTFALIVNNFPGVAFSGFILMLIAALGVIFYSIKLIANIPKLKDIEDDKSKDLINKSVSSFIYITILLAAMITVNIKYVPYIVETWNSIMN